MIEEIRFTDGNTFPAGTCFCVGQNYAKHAAEMGSSISKEPVIFLKPSQALVNSGSTIMLPDYSNDVHHEIELVVLIGKDAVDISEADAKDYIAGYGVGIDLTLRDLQAQAKSQGKPWTTAKAFRESAPISEFLPADLLADNIFALKLLVNGEERQSCLTNEMERSVEQLVSYLSRIFTLKKGDLIFTGTPEGVAKLNSGDKAEAFLNDKLMLTINFE